jgi:RsiW-degrading membrane proteinase PrsW (M82 family)
MKQEYRFAVVALAVAVLSAALGAWIGFESALVLVVLAAIAGPAAVVAALKGRLDRPVPVGAVVGGGTIGPVVAVASHTIVAAFVYAFVIGFADTFTGLLDRFRADPQLVDVLTSPWLLVAMISVAAVAPLTEEAGKGLGAVVARPAGRREAFLAGAAAGAGFAAVENLLYVGLGAAFGGPWPVIALGRLLGVAVHPLASGLVMLGWWEWCTNRSPMTLLRGYLAGVGVHALWNGSLVVFAAVETAYGLSGSALDMSRLGLAYLMGLGAAAAVGLWQLTDSVAGRRRMPGSVRDVRSLAAWVVATGTLLVPVTIMILVFPDFYRG